MRRCTYKPPLTLRYVGGTRLENEQIEVRLCAAGTIGHINPDTSIDVIPFILDGLSNMDGNTIRIPAIEALVKIGDSNKEVVDTLIHLIKSEDNILRERSIEALIELRPEQEDILPHLLELISDEEDSIVCFAAEILGQLQSDEALQILLEAAGLDNLDDNTIVIPDDCIQSAISEYEGW